MISLYGNFENKGGSIYLIKNVH